MLVMDLLEQVGLAVKVLVGVEGVHDDVGVDDVHEHGEVAPWQMVGQEACTEVDEVLVEVEVQVIHDDSSWLLVHVLWEPCLLPVVQLPFLQPEKSDIISSKLNNTLS